MNERMLSSRAENFLKHGLPATIALGGIAVFGVSYAADNLTHETPECTPTNKQVTVQSGDTLWSIAESLAPNDDPRDTIHDIAISNPDAVDASKIHPGATLSVEVCLPDKKAE